MLTLQLGHLLLQRRDWVNQLDQVQRLDLDWLTHVSHGGPCCTGTRPQPLIKYHAHIALSISTDEGVTWSAPIKANKTPVDQPAFVPTLAVMADGTAGLSYYDLRNNTPTQNAILADHWLLYCHAGCSGTASWNETHIDGPFDMQRAPHARGFFVGDYHSLVSAGNTFMLVFAATNPADDSRYSDDHFATATLPVFPHSLNPPMPRTNDER